MPLRLTGQADADILGILQFTLTTFGERQAGDYAALIQEALRLVEVDPRRTSARPRDDIRDGVRSFHVALASSRRGAASHLIYFIEPEPTEIVVLRVLHEQMEPKRRILDSLRRPDTKDDRSS